MRIWDIDPGYLNRQSLLGEHVELHGLVSILINGKTGYSHHPETLRWRACGWALHRRHRQLAAEMTLRGYAEKSPVDLTQHKGRWPECYIDEPWRQFELLRDKYVGKSPGRIALPTTAQELWRQHKYSVLARDVPLYHEIGRQVSGPVSSHDLAALATTLSELLRVPPSEGGMRNALLHMWGYVSKLGSTPSGAFDQWTAQELLGEIQQRAMIHQVPYLLSSTALGELTAWTQDE